MEQYVAQSYADEGLTIGERWRRHALRAVSATPQLRFRSDRTFAQHGLLGAPDALIVRVAVENTGAQPIDICDLDVAFDVVDGSAFDAAESAGWHGTGAGWSFTISQLGERLSAVLVHRDSVAPGEAAEATFRLRMAHDAHLPDTLSLRASGRVDGQDGSWSCDIRVPVERLAL